MSGMAFGVTSENPARINMHDLPEDADELLDRSKSFIVYKNVANTPNARDCLIFSMTENGEEASTIYFEINYFFVPMKFSQSFFEENFFSQSLEFFLRAACNFSFLFFF